MVYKTIVAVEQSMNLNYMIVGKNTYLGQIILFFATFLLKHTINNEMHEI